MIKSILIGLVTYTYISANSNQEKIKEIVLYSYNTENKILISTILEERNIWLKKLDGFISIETIKSDTQKNQYVDIVIWKNKKAYVKASKLFETSITGSKMMTIMDMDQPFIISTGKAINKVIK